MLLLLILSLLIFYLPLQSVQLCAASPTESIGGVALLTATIMLAFWLVSRAAVRSTGSGRCDGPRRRRPFRLFRVFILAAVIADVFAFKWPVFVSEAFARDGKVAFLPFIDDLLLISPLLIMVAAAMAFQYRAERRLKRLLLSMKDYFLLRLRVEIGIVLIPWLIMVLMSDTIDLLFGGTEFVETAETVATTAVLASLFFFGPVLLARIWNTSSMPDGLLRRRLVAFCNTHNFRCRDLLLWHTHGHIGNAAVAGLVPNWRYVILSDVLVEECEDDEIIAILAHEIAHVKLRHLRFYVAFALGYLVFHTNLNDIASAIAPATFGHADGVLSSEVSLWGAVLLVLFSVFYWGILFGYISRRLELQADLYGAGIAGGPYRLARALQKLVAISGISRKANSWRHFSVDRRIAFLEAAQDEEFATAFSRRISRIRLVFLVLFIIAALRTIAFHSGLI